MTTLPHRTTQLGVLGYPGAAPGGFEAAAAWNGDPEHPYRVRDFLGDQRRVLLAEEPRAPLLEALEALDGRRQRVYCATLLGSLTHQRPLQAFFEGYTLQAAVERFLRFVLVLSCLEQWKDTIVWSGLALPGEPLSVREEFLQYLLAYRLKERTAIPKDAVLSFLDQWGLRM